MTSRSRERRNEVKSEACVQRADAAVEHHVGNPYGFLTETTSGDQEYAADDGDCGNDVVVEVLFGEGKPACHTNKVTPGASTQAYREHLAHKPRPWRAGPNQHHDGSTISSGMVWEPEAVA